MTNKFNFRLDDDNVNTPIPKIIIREMGKLNTHRAIYCMTDSCETWLNLRHPLDRMYLASIWDIQNKQVRLHNDDHEVF